MESPRPKEPQRRLVAIEPLNLAYRNAADSVITAATYHGNLKTFAQIALIGQYLWRRRKYKEYCFYSVSTGTIVMLLRRLSWAPLKAEDHPLERVDIYRIVGSVLL